MLHRLICIVSLLALLTVGGFRCANGIQFDRNCSGYLKRAGDANTIEIAEKELVKALDYIEKHDLKDGYTSILYRTPDEDIGFWYTNLHTSLEELKKLPAEVTPLERSNMLIKLRETLLDHGQGGDHVTIPAGITIYPANLIYALLCWIFLIIVVVSGVVWFVKEA
jgi:hypothetical protein